MKPDEFVPVDELCSHYEVQISFFNQLSDFGLVEFTTVKEVRCVHIDNIAEVERIIRLRDELDLNLEAIDTVYGLLERIKKLEKELLETRSKLGIYEGP